MKIKRVIILGIDALEHSLVEKWDLKNLKQVEYGKTILPIYSGEEPNTRIVWPCFITGKMPKEMGYVTHKVFPRPIQIFVNIFSLKFKSILNPQTDNPQDIVVRKKNTKVSLIRKIYNIFEKLKIVRTPNTNDIKAKTIFDNNKRRIHRHIPIYDEYLPDYSSRAIEAIENKMYRPIFEHCCSEELKNRSKEVFKYLKKKNYWDIFMEYFWFLDGIQHVYFKNIKKIAKYYVMIDNFVGKLRKRVDDETLILIVSDHGQKKGMHTPYGFYSVNKKLGLKKPKLIDFKTKIEELIKK